MEVKELKCTRCFAPVDLTRGQVTRCVYCGTTLVIGGAVNEAAPPISGYGYPQATAGVGAVILEGSGQNKISVIKVVRTFLRLGLREAKDLVESAPCTLPSLSDALENDTFRQELKKVGAKVR